MLQRTARKEIRSNKEAVRLWVDVAMLVIVVANLLFIVFDWHFGFQFFRDFLKAYFPDFFAFYRDEVHPNFLLYDLVFVTIFATELLVQWIMAIRRERYEKWWLYPVIHWYDVLGCIPLGTFVWLRLFRVISILVKLDRMGVVDLKSTFIYRQFYSVYQIFVDEVSDRALIQLIEAIQRAVKSESDGNILVEAVKPSRDELAAVLSSRLQQVAAENYRTYREDMKEQIRKTVSEGFDQSEQIRKIGQLPLIGSQITEALESSLNDISFNLADQLANRLASDEIAHLVQDSIRTSLETVAGENEGESPPENQSNLSQILKDIVDRALEQLIEDIRKGESSKERRIPKPGG